MIWLEILIGSILIVITIVIHGTATRYVIHLVNKQSDPQNKFHKHPKEYWVSAMVLLLFVASLVESFIWAICYMVINAMQTIEQAMYFSLVTYTTLGYGDLTLSKSWRLLSSFEAANGIIIFGWSTAIVMAVVQKLYFNK